jgi:O-antigen/teichoic acid export membrane protein
VTEPSADTPFATAPVEAVVPPSVRRRLLQGTSWVLGGRVAAIVLGLVINAVLARLMDPAELGAYFTIFTLVLLGSIVARMGMDRVAVRFISSSLGTGRDARAGDAIRIALTVSVGGALVVGLALSLGVGAWLARDVYHSPAIEAVVPLAAAWLVLTTIRTVLVEVFRGFQRFDLAILFDSLLVDVLAASVFGSLLLLRVQPTLSWVVAFSAGFAAASLAVAVWPLLRRLRVLGRDGGISRDEIFHMAWPVMVTDLAVYLLSTGADLWVLAAFRPPSEVAIYGAATRLIVFMVMPFRILQGVNPPLIAELHAQGRRQELERALRAGAALAAAPSVLILILFVVAGSPILGRIYGPFYAQGALVLAILSVGRLVAVWTGSCGVALLMTGHHRPMMQLTIVSGLISVTGGIVAAANFGMVAVAITTASAAILQNLLQLLLARRLIGIWTHAYLSPLRVLRYLRGRETHADSETGWREE